MKKGELTLKGVIELLVAGTVIALFLWVALEFGSESFYVQSKLARDGAAFVSVFQAIPGNTWVSVEPNIPHYTFVLQKDQVLVESEIPFTQHFSGNVVPARLTDAKPLYFLKDGTRITIADKEPQLKKWDCADFTYKPSNIKMRVTEETRIIAEKGLVLKCSNAYLCAVSDSALNEQADMFVKIIPMSREGIAVRYPRASLESKKLACAFVNKLTAANIWLLLTNDPEITPRGLLIEVGGDHTAEIVSALQGIFKEATLA